MPPQLGFRTFSDPPDDAATGSRFAAPASPAPMLSPGRLSLRSTLIVLAFAGLMLLPALGGSLRVLTVHEVFAAQTAREMLQAGDWIIPHFAGVPRLNKPPGMYWLIAGFMAVFQSRDEWVVRLPAALAGIVTAILMARLTARWLGNFAGLVAGLMQASLFYVLMQARLAEADMPMCAALTLAMSAFAAGVVDPTAGRTRGRTTLLALLFGVGTGLSVLLKGVGIAFIPAGCLPWILLTRHWRAVRFMLNPASLLPLVLLAGAWPLAAWLRDPKILDVWYFETFQRAGGAFGDSDPWHIYFWSVPLLMLPWLPFAIRGGIAWWRESRDGTLAGSPEIQMPRTSRAAKLGLTPQLAFLLCWFAGGMTILMFSLARHKHYAIPMLPPLTVLAAAGFVGWLGDPFRRPVRRVAILSGIVLLAGAIAAVLTWRLMPNAAVGTAITVAAITLGVVAVVALHAARRWRLATAACFLTALAGGLGVQLLVLPAFDDYKASAQLAREADRLTPPGETIHLVLLGQTQAAYYIDHPMRRVDGRQKFLDHFRQSEGQTFYILCQEATAAELTAVGRVEKLAEADHLRKSEEDRLVFVRLEK